MKPHITRRSGCEPSRQYAGNIELPDGTYRSAGYHPTPEAARDACVDMYDKAVKVQELIDNWLVGR